MKWKIDEIHVIATATAKDGSRYAVEQECVGFWNYWEATDPFFEFRVFVWCERGRFWQQVGNMYTKKGWALRLYNRLLAEHSS